MSDVVLSSIKSDVVESKLLHAYNVMHLVDTVKFPPAHTVVPGGYKWTRMPDNHHAHMMPPAERENPLDTWPVEVAGEGYKDYLIRKLDLSNIADCEMIIAPKDLLNATDVGYLSKISGACDCAVVFPGDPISSLQRAKIFVAIEIKKPMTVRNQQAENQTMATHFTADFVSRYPVVTLLTDLNGCWSLRWFTKAPEDSRFKYNVHVRRYNPETAINHLRNFIRYSAAAALREFTDIPQPAEVPLLPTLFEGIIKLPLRPELRAAAETQDMEMDRDGDNDVARMEDVLEGDELDQWHQQQEILGYLRYCNIFEDWRREQNQKFEILGV